MLLHSMILSQFIIINSGFLQFTNEHNVYMEELLNHLENVINANFLFWSHDQYIEQMSTLYHLKNITQLENLEILFNKTRDNVTEDTEEDFNRTLKDQLFLYVKYLFLKLNQNQDDMFDKAYFTKKLNSALILLEHMTELEKIFYYDYDVTS